MRSLVTCDDCSHGASLHASDGCQVFRCRCDRARTGIVDDALGTARREYQEAWSRAVRGAS